MLVLKKRNLLPNTEWREALGFAKALIHEVPGHCASLHSRIFFSLCAFTSHFLAAGRFLRRVQIQQSILLLPEQSSLSSPLPIYTLLFQILIISQHKVPHSFSPLPASPLHPFFFNKRHSWPLKD